MLEANQAAEMLNIRDIMGMDDPTEPNHPYRWYWNRATGELNLAGHKDPCPKTFPEYRNIRWLVEAAKEGQPDEGLEPSF